MHWEMHSGMAFFSRVGPWDRILCIWAILHLYLFTHMCYALARRFFGVAICKYIVGITWHRTLGMGLGNDHHDHDGGRKNSQFGVLEKGELI